MHVIKTWKYVIKVWAACESTLSDAWNLQVYTRKLNEGGPEKTQGMRVVLDMIQGLGGHNITCDIFFNLTWVGTRAPKKETDHCGNDTRKQVWTSTSTAEYQEQAVNSSKLVYTSDTSLESYVPKKGKDVVLMSTLHRYGRICGQEHQKPEIILHYNATRGDVDNMDKLVTASCKRRTLRWLLVIFFDILDISAYNAFAIWMTLDLYWNRGKLQKRCLCLEALGKALVRP